MRSFLKTFVILVSAFLLTFPSFTLADDENDTHGEYIFDEGDKVDTYNGILTFPRTDLFLPGKGGLDVEITRTYSSQVNYDTIVPYGTQYNDPNAWGSIRPIESPFGMGWYFQVGRIDVAKKIIYYGDGGSEELFYDNYGGSLRYRMKTRQYAVWEYTEGQDYSYLIMPRGIILKFDMTSNDQVYGSSNKYVVQIENKNGHHIDIEYFPNTPFIRKICDTLGRTIWFTYFDTTNFSRDTRLAKISYLNSNQDTSEITYEYDDNNLLAKVTYPNGTYESYEYAHYYYPGGYYLSAVVLPTGGRIEYSYGYIIERKWLVKEQLVTCVVEAELWTWHTSIVLRKLVGSEGIVSKRDFDYDAYASWWDWEFKCHNLQEYDEESYPDFFNNGVCSRMSGVREYIGDYLGDIEYIHYPFVLVSDSSDCMKPWYTGSLKTIRWDEYPGGDHKTTSFIYDRQVIGYTNPDFHTEDSAVWVPVVKDVYKSDYFVSWDCSDQKGRDTKAIRYLRDSHTGTILNRKVYSLSDSLDDWNLDNAEQFLVREDAVVDYNLDSYFNYLYVEGSISIEGDDIVYNQYQYNFLPLGGYLYSLTKKTFISEGESLTTSFGYDTSGNVNQVVNPNGDTLYFNYDSFGAYKTSTKSPVYGIIDSTTYYHNTGLPQTKVDANGNETEFYYDQADRIQKIIRPLDSDTINPSIYYLYDDSNRIVYEFVKQEDGNYITSSKHFDEFGRLYKTEAFDESDVINTIIEYNSMGKVKRVSRAFKNTPSDTVWTEFEYDILGRMIRTTNPDSTRDSTYYHELTVERYDELNRRAKSIYDVRGNLLYSSGNWDETDSVYQDTLSYTYGTFNKVLEAKDPKGLVTKYWYNSLLRVSADSTVDRGKNHYIYDRVGNLRFRKDANGVWIYNKYDRLNRLIEQGTLPPEVTPTQENAYGQNYPNGIGEECKIKNRYDSYSDGVVPDDPVNHTNPKGNLTEVVDASGHTYYFYDKRNRPVQKNIYISGLTEKKIKYHYNYADQIDTLYYPDGSAVTYQYDQIGRLENIPDYVDSADHGFMYTPWGAIQRILFNNGILTFIEYNDRGSVTRMRTLAGIFNLLWGRSYAHDAAGNIIREYSLNLVGTIADTVRAYEYDNLNRLASAQLRDYNKLISYGYDRNGNRAFRAVNSDTLWYFYNPNTNQLNHITHQVEDNYLYDGRGSITEDKSKSLNIGYDYRNMPTSFHININNGYENLSSQYDASGRRVKKIYTYCRWGLEQDVLKAGTIGGDEPNEPDRAPSAKGSGNDTLKAADIRLNEPGELTLAPALPGYKKIQTVTYYVYSGSQVIAEYNKHGRLTANYIYGNGQRLVKQDSQGNKFFYHNDYLGSTRIMTDASGNKVFERDYYPFGSELMSSGYKTDYTYNGKEFDQEMGIYLYYYGARYYDPQTGRFISVDPVKDYTNPYSYVRNNPINATDPTGMVTQYRPLLTHGGFFGIIGRAPGSWRDPMAEIYYKSQLETGGQYKETYSSYITAEYEGEKYTVWLGYDEEQGRFYIDFDAKGSIHSGGGVIDLLNDMFASSVYNKDENGTKCNIFAYDFYDALGIKYPRQPTNNSIYVANDLYNLYEPSERNEYTDRSVRGDYPYLSFTTTPLPGDMVVWYEKGHGHVGIYGGGNKFYGRGASVENPGTISGNPIYIGVQYPDDRIQFYYDDYEFYFEP